MLIEVGRTRVICTASVEDRVPPFLRGAGKGWVTAEYGMLPRATTTRTQREATAGKVGGRTQEIQRLIGRSLRSVVEHGRARRTNDLGRLRRHSGRRRHADGVDHRRRSSRWCSRSSDCASRARSPRVPITDYVAATSVGVVAGTPLLDLAYDEDSQRRRRHERRQDVGRPVHRGAGHGRDAAVQSRELDALLALAERGITDLIDNQREIVGKILKY